MRVKTIALVFNEGEPDELKFGNRIDAAEHDEMTDEMALNQALGELRYTLELLKPFGEMRPRVLEWTGDAPEEEPSDG